MATRSLPSFLLQVTAWLLLTFFVWWLATPLLAWPVAVLSHIVTRLGFGDLVQSVEQSAEMITFVTSLRPPGTLPGGAKAVFEVPANYRLFSFGLPLLAAMILAAREPRPLRRLAIGYALLIPAQTFSVVADFLKNLLSEPGITSQLTFQPWQRELITFCYQFGTLILPTVAPAIVWVLMHRRFLERFAGRRAD
ncbi:MAG: exosortase H-associated membrane protein [Betaproteobacteria bacterium]